jgi:hypothetical protein
MYTRTRSSGPIPSTAASRTRVAIRSASSTERSGATLISRSTCRLRPIRRVRTGPTPWTPGTASTAPRTASMHSLARAASIKSLGEPHSI